jgi:hypothetical protein
MATTGAVQQNELFLGAFVCVATLWSSHHSGRFLRAIRKQVPLDSLVNIFTLLQGYDLIASRANRNKCLEAESVIRKKKAV